MKPCNAAKMTTIVFRSGHGYCAGSNSAGHGDVVGSNSCDGW